MSTGRLVARWLALDPSTRRTPVRPRPEVPRQRTWQEGRWHEFFHTGAPAPAPGRRSARQSGGFFTPTTA